jgi:siroheme decarboxylase
MDATALPLADLGLVNRFQRDFPLVPRPFEEIGRALCRDEADLIATLQRLQAGGVVSRVGAVFAPLRAGASTLAAMAAPPARLDEVAAIVSRCPQVNHNYERDSPLNLWFVANASSPCALERLLAGLEQRTGCEILRMPLEREYHIDLAFDLLGRGDCAGRRRHPALPAPPARTWTGPQRRLQRALQDGLALVPRPFDEAGERAAMAGADVQDAIARWLRDGVARRFGIVVRHHELGYTANAMCVWDVPDATLEDLGPALASNPFVTLCYQRRRAGSRWPFNLYCMIHGRSRADVAAQLDALRLRHGLGRFRSEVLYTRRRFKQQGARYLDDLDHGHKSHEQRER